MRLAPPTLAPRFTLDDVDGNPTVVAGTIGHRILLCFFRDAACPFCNYRIHELTRRHARLSGLGLEVIAVFSSTLPEVQRFVLRKPRPFRIIADPTSTAHDAYGIERSAWRKLKGIVTRIPTAVKGLRIVGLAGLNTNNLMPADFLIDEGGRIVESWYGRDAGDRIPFEHVESFMAKGFRGNAATIA